MRPAIRSQPQYTLNVLGTGGTLLLLSGVIVAIAYRIPFRDAVAAYGATLHQLRFTIITVTAVLALAYVMNYSGQTQSLGSALAATGAFFSMLSPAIGWLGVAITGSDTSSNALFGLLQATTAEQVGLNPILMAATNSSAGVLGKMLSPQNLAVAAAAASMAGREGELFRKLIGWSLGHARRLHRVRGPAVHTDPRLDGSGRALNAAITQQIARGGRPGCAGSSG